MNGALSRASSISNLYFTSHAVLYLFFSSWLIYLMFWTEPLWFITFSCISAFHWFWAIRSRTRWGLTVTAYILKPYLIEILLDLILNPLVFPSSKDVTGSAWMDVKSELRIPWCFMLSLRFYHYSEEWKSFLASPSLLSFVMP